MVLLGPCPRQARCRDHPQPARTLCARDLVLARFSAGVVYCGPIEVTPRAFNIVPAKALLALELRHGGKAHLDHREDALFDLAEGLAQDQVLMLAKPLAGRFIVAPLNECVM